MLMIKSALVAVFLTAVGLSMVMTSPVAAAAHESTQTLDSAKAYVDATGKRALQIISNKSLSKAAKKEQLEALFADKVDVEWVGKFVMGRFWRQATPQQRTRYIKEYRDFVVANYAGRFADYSGGSYKITHAQQDGNDSYKVGMEMRSPEGQNVVVNYRMHPVDSGKLKIYDVIVEGVSLITTQRSEFAAVLNNKGIDYLISQLAKRTESARKS